MALVEDYLGVVSKAFFSDGAVSHFKQRFLFHNITYFEEDYGIETTWDFIATSHGKGAVDGIGGHVNQLVSKREENRPGP